MLCCRLLSYQYVPDILEKRGPYREAHLAGARKHLDAGRLVAAGAVGDPVEGATFFFKDISKVCVGWWWWWWGSEVC